MRLSLYNTLGLIVISTVVTGCMSSASISVLKPAQISIPQHIKKIAVTNRSLPDKKSKVGNVVEGILTGEGLFNDREASADCIFGVNDILVKTPRFDVTQPANLDLRGTGTGVLPSPLDWATVEKICKDNSADALLTLEAFDSDSRLEFGVRERKVKNKEGTYITVIDKIADVRMRVTSGWRLYDPKNKVLVDEVKATDHKNFEGVGKTQEIAERNLPMRRNMVKETGFFAGQEYGWRISPMWVRVSRSYYTRGNDDLKMAGRKAKVNDWDGATREWKRMAEGSWDTKEPGRASYNMALACEIEGKLELAQTWAQKSYSDYGNKKGRNYSNVLRRRIRDEARVKEQMGEDGP